MSLASPWQRVGSSYATIGATRICDPVPWRDLLHLSSSEKTYELLLSLPWLLATLYLFHNGWYAGALLASFFFFLTGLRQVHNACHDTLGIPHWACDGVLFVLSVLMLSAMHAIQVTHMHHHRHCLEDDDIEAATAKISGWPAALGAHASHQAALLGLLTGPF